jgi:hypothetical protein
VALAGDLVAAQLVVRFWLDPGSWAERHAWIISVVFWVFLVSINAAHVRAYGEMGLYLSRATGAEIHRIHRILAVFPQSSHRHRVHLCRHRREWGRESGACSHRVQELGYTWCTVRRWLWRVCQGLCHRKLCLHVPFFRMNTNTKLMKGQTAVPRASESRPAKRRIRVRTCQELSRSSSGGKSPSSCPHSWLITSQNSSVLCSFHLPDRPQRYAS